LPWRAVLRRRDGAAAVEFAIISAVLLPMLFGLIAFSTTLFAMSSMQARAAEAARRAAVDKTNAAVQTTGTNVNCGSGRSTTSTNVEYHACRNLPTFGTYRVNASLNCGTRDVTVTMTTVTSPALGDIYRLVSGATLTATAVSRWEDTVCP